MATTTATAASRKAPPGRKREAVGVSLELSGQSPHSSRHDDQGSRWLGPCWEKDDSRPPGSSATEPAAFPALRWAFWVRLPLLVAV